MKIKKLVIIGAGGFGREVAEIVKRINLVHPTYEIIGFVIQEDYWGRLVTGDLINGIPFLGSEKWILEHKEEVVCICAIGTPGAKARLQQELMNNGVIFENIIAPGVLVPDSVKIGQGCVFYDGVGLPVNGSIGNGVLLNAYVTVGHDCEIGDYSCIMTGTGISGYCKIGRMVEMGGHAFLIPKRKVGDNAKISAGSIVMTHVKADTTVLGNPAKRMKFLED